MVGDRIRNTIGRLSDWMADLAIIALGLLLTGVAMAGALLAFAEKIERPKQDPWGATPSERVSSR